MAVHAAYNKLSGTLRLLSLLAKGHISFNHTPNVTIQDPHHTLVIVHLWQLELGSVPSIPYPSV